MNVNKAITILIIDDHPIFRQGLIDVISLNGSFTIVGESSDGLAGLDLIRSLRPDISIVDINLPGMNGQQITKTITQEKIQTRIFLLTAYDDGEQEMHSYWAGAAGYSSKDINPDVLMDAIIGINQGKYFLSGRIITFEEFSSWMNKQMDNARHLYSEPGSPFHPLSSREMEVLSLMVDGKSNKEIASFLGISHQTVKNHVTSVLRKFGVEDRTQAVVYAVKRGWIQLEYKSEKIQE